MGVKWENGRKRAACCKMVYWHGLLLNVDEDAPVCRHMWISVFIWYCGCHGGRGHIACLWEHRCEHMCELWWQSFQFTCMCVHVCVCRNGHASVTICFWKSLLEVKPFGSKHQKMNLTYSRTWPPGLTSCRVVWKPLWQAEASAF